MFTACATLTVPGNRDQALRGGFTDQMKDRESIDSYLVDIQVRRLPRKQNKNFDAQKQSS
jgi:hypothetical protein